MVADNPRDSSYLARAIVRLCAVDGVVHVEGDDDLLPLPRLGEGHLAAVVLRLPALQGRQAPRILLLRGDLLLQEGRQLLVTCG